MAARSAIAPKPWRRPFLTWLDGTERGWAIPLLLALFVVTWWLFLTIAHLGVDLHYDTLETWTIGRFFPLGSVNHPPLMGWVAGLWTLLFPLTDWSFQLLAMLNAALALWAVDLITRRFVRGDKRIFVLLLLMVTPVYQFHAQRFNANSVLLAVWPLAIYAFLRSFETRTIAWSALAGALAALAMLGKYYSAFLIASFVLAAILHPGRAAYFRSTAPWVSTIVGLIVLGPHLYWLATTGATPLKFVAEQSAGVSRPKAIANVVLFILGFAAALVPLALVWALTAERRLRGFSRDIAELSPGLKLLGLIMIPSIALPALYALAAETKMPSLWALQGLFLIPLIVVCAARFEIERFYTVNLAVFVILVAAVSIVVAAPLYARSEMRDNHHRVFYSAAAREITERWHAATGGPLMAIGGDSALGFATAFYSPDHPAYWRPNQPSYSPTPTREQLDRGWAAICFATERLCSDAIAQATAMAKRPMRVASTITRTQWGKTVQADIVGVMSLPVGKPTAGQPHADAAQDVGANRRR